MSTAKWSTALIAALAMGFASPSFAANDSIAVEIAAASLAPNEFIWNDVVSAKPVRLVINIAEQRAYVYRGEALVAATTISTGKSGKDTPSGIFTVLQKKIDHRSNLYNDAAMPFMQRLTWDGVAIHAGKNPGFAASHGCVRVPLAFAKKLYGVTTVGTTVTVIGVGGEVAPSVYNGSGTTSDTAKANKPELQLALN